MYKISACIQNQCMCLNQFLECSRQAWEYECSYSHMLFFSLSLSQYSTQVTLLHVVSQQRAQHDIMLTMYMNSIVQHCQQTRTSIVLSTSSWTACTSGFHTGVFAGGGRGEAWVVTACSLCQPPVAGGMLTRQTLRLAKQPSLLQPMFNSLFANVHVRT